MEKMILVKVVRMCYTKVKGVYRDMEKLALIEISNTSIRMTVSKIKEGSYFVPIMHLQEHVGIDEHIEKDFLIKNAKIRECVAILQMYKKICEAEGVSRYQAVAANNLTQAKNYLTFIEEAGNCIGIEFRLMTKDEEIAAVYNAVTNTLDAQKGLIINVSAHSVRLVHYNRRIILDSVTIPLGTATLFKQTEGEADQIRKMTDIFTAELGKAAPFLGNLDPELVIVGVGDTFTSLANLARKISKYPIDINHNYNIPIELFEKVSEFLGGLDPEKRQKLRGVAGQTTQSLLAGMTIIQTVIGQTKINNIVIGNAYRSTGLLFNYAIPYTVERPVPDLLSYSLDAIIDNLGLKKSVSEQMYDLALMLFKQLKVLHKLPRGYAKVLKIAAYLYNVGGLLNGGSERNNYHMILSLPLYGASHKDILLAGFVSSCKRWEDFNLAEWIKYKEILTDDDLDAARKISAILAMAEALNIRNQDVVKDITCDILGDSVIIKLITDTDTKNLKVDPHAANIEIFYAKKYAGEFNRAFKKTLEIL